MSSETDFNPGGNGGINGVVPTRTVAMMYALVGQLLDAPNYMPRLGVLSGSTGVGKTVAALSTRNEYRCYYVRCQWGWTKKPLLQAILSEMGIRPAKAVYEMAAQVVEQLSASGRVLVIDEMDYMVDTRQVEMIRDLHDQAKTPILMIGEELFPQKLKRWERFHNRVLVWKQALPADMEDVRQIARHYAPEIPIAEDLLARVRHETRGCVRTLSVNIYNMNAVAQGEGWDAITVERWGNRPLFTGAAPTIRRGDA